MYLKKIMTFTIFKNLPLLFLQLYHLSLYLIGENLAYNWSCRLDMLDSDTYWLSQPEHSHQPHQQNQKSLQ